MFAAFRGRKDKTMSSELRLGEFLDALLGLPPEVKPTLENQSIRGAFWVNAHKFLRQMEFGKVSPAGWQAWGIQRYQAAVGFIDLLESALEKSKQAGLKRSPKTLYENLCEERGISSKDGRAFKSGSHDDWRKDFYRALGITEEQLVQTPSLPETQAYANTLKDIKENADVWKHLGVLLEMEFAIGREMMLLERGLVATPELKHLFTESADMPWRTAMRNILYVKHHAAHDAGHYKELLEAMISDISSAARDNIELRIEILDKVTEGIKTIAGARADLYDGMQRHITGETPEIHCARN